MCCDSRADTSTSTGTSTSTVSVVRVVGVMGVLGLCGIARLNVARMGVAGLALPDTTLLVARCSLELLVFLVLAGEEELQADHSEEEDCSDDS